ncbi:sulfonate ABC transporter substrate-binding protein [Vulcanococcus limneticus]|uniref:sulfonate ABC transporter substrate-binding protein n=2 Tax=Vulcanococcus limneticus TaxID=2170428 RepID=UPI00398BD2B2
MPANPAMPHLKAATRIVPVLGLGVLGAAVLLPGSVPLGLELGSTARAAAKPVVLRIGHQKFDPLTLVKFRGDLEAKLKPLGVTEVKWVEFPSGPPILEALSVGSIDIGRTGDTPPVVAQAAGVPFVYVGTSEPKARSSAILVKKNSPIRSLADLKGKKIAFGKSTSAHYFTIKALQSAGLSLKDVEPVYLAPADARSAFNQGSIDAWAIWDPFNASTAAQSDVRVLITSEGLVTNRDFYLATKSFAQENPDVIRGLRRETQAVSRWANRNDDKVVAFFSPLIKLDPSVLQVVVKRRDFSFVPFTPKVVAEQQEIADSFAKLKLIPRPIKVQSAVDPAFLK